MTWHDTNPTREHELPPLEAEKQAAYMLGMEETQARLTEEFSAVCRDYCDISLGKDLDVVGVPMDSDLR